MIRSILDLKWTSLFIFMVSDAEFKVVRNRSNGVHSQEFVEKIFKEHPHETIIFEYKYNIGLFGHCKKLFAGDFSEIWGIGIWLLKKTWSCVGIPSAVLYCSVGYIIYRVYKIIRYLDGLFVSSKNQNKADEVLVENINTLLYRRISHNKKISRKSATYEIFREKEKLYLLLKQYQSISHSLELCGIRNLFLYNSYYEKTITHIISILENSLSLPNFKKKI